MSILNIGSIIHNDGSIDKNVTHKIQASWTKMENGIGSIMQP